MMSRKPTPIRFGTDGWRAIIADDYTLENLARVSFALARWLKEKKESPRVVIGHDCRFGGERFAEWTAQVLCENGIQVLLARGFVSTPMVSLGVLRFQADQGVVITASHNPPSYNGFKLKGPHGGPSSPEHIAQVEALIPDQAPPVNQPLSYWVEKGMLEYVDLEDLYIKHLESHFDLEALRNAPYKLAYDAMYGAGQGVMRRLFPDAVFLNADENPGFRGQAPEPLEKNLQELGRTMARNAELGLGLATDGDADRIGLFDENGRFVDAHHIILLLIHYLHRYRKQSGKVAVAFSATDRIRRMAEAYGLPFEVTPIGFKYISEIMVREEVLVGGEESGGIAVMGHIPERDGIYDGLLIYSFMQETGKMLSELCEEIYEVVGRFVYERLDLNLDNAVKEQIMANAQNQVYTRFGSYGFGRTETIDGVKYLLDNGGWVLLRASGTEPLLRIYAEGSSEEETQDILRAVKETVLPL